MRKIISMIIIASMVTLQPSYASPVINNPTEDSRELQLQDMLVLFLLPYMNNKLAEVYAEVLTGAPDLYPYFVDVKHIERVNGFRGYDFVITLDATPTVGPHITVGQDIFTYQISPVVGVKLIKFQHLKGPDKKNFPPNYQDILR
ncbi:hypothetical protein J2T17_007647 [Paenibacillus mucilaginosus]|uniref:DUF3888 domain-containing protein n=1 Tax=Paenibacillus mucilaginosus TaxID=61624 RepID=UPI003D23B3FF